MGRDRGKGEGFSGGAGVAGPEGSGLRRNFQAGMAGVGRRGFQFSQFHGPAASMELWISEIGEGQVASSPDSGGFRRSISGFCRMATGDVQPSMESRLVATGHSGPLSFGAGQRQRGGRLHFSDCGGLHPSQSHAAGGGRGIPRFAGGLPLEQAGGIREWQGTGVAGDRPGAGGVRAGERTGGGRRAYAAWIEERGKGGGDFRGGDEGAAAGVSGIREYQRSSAQAVDFNHIPKKSENPHPIEKCQIVRTDPNHVDFTLP